MRRIVFALLLAVGGCRSSQGPISLAVPGAANANVTVAADADRAIVAWAAAEATGTNLYVARSDDGGATFGEPIRVNDIDGDASVNGEAPPRVLLSGNRVRVIWTSKRSGVSGVRAAASEDGGRTFAPAATISSAGVTGARGWQNAALAADGTAHIVWLDGRNAGSRAQHGDMRQDIYHASWRGDGPVVETPIAANVCFCCKTAVAVAGDAVYVAWRHLFPGGVRDIAFARSNDGGRSFSDPVRVSADDWHLDACPDDGPAIAVDQGSGIHVTWPTVIEERGQPARAVFASTSRDGGATFNPRARLDSGGGAPAHPRLALDAQGRPAFIWDELAGGGRKVMFRQEGGSAVGLSDGRIASYPALARVAGGYLVAWTDQSNNASVIKIARVPLTRP